MNRQQRRAANAQNKKLYSDNQNKLVLFYWGYKANEPDGFEFNNIQLMNMGWSHEATIKIGKLIKESVDDQVQSYVNDTTMIKFGLSREDFIKEEKDRLENAIIQYHYLVNSSCMFNEIAPVIVVICCAISTLVAAGVIKQDTYNGDSFGYGKV